MIREFLITEWQRRRLSLLLVSAVYAVNPVISLLGLSVGGAARPGAREAVLQSQSTGLLLLTSLCLAAGIWGGGSWTDERRGGWVYALSLPIGRVQLFTLRYLAGLMWLLLPFALLGVLAYLAAGAADLPPGVYAYPGAFVRWVVLTGWLLYTLTFVLAVLFDRPLLVVLGAAVVLVLLQIVIQYGAVGWLSRFFEMLFFGDLSPLRIFRDVPLLFGF
jgi:hypothetical protein